MTYAYALPTEWSLPITAPQREAAQRSTQRLRYGRGNAYLNTLCLNAFLHWLPSEYRLEAQAWLPSLEQQALGGLVLGVAVVLPALGWRILLLPSETSDTDAIEVPQEWIDIPTWTTDYILAVQVDPDEASLLAWSYTTQAKVKAEGIYDRGDRTYVLAGHHLHRDLNVFSQILQYCSNAPALVEPTVPVTLTDGEADALIESLGNLNSPFVRQSVSFQQWAALLNAPRWRQQLSQYRLRAQAAAEAVAEGAELTNVELTETRTDAIGSVATKLKSWFSAAATQGWQSVEEWLGSAESGALTVSFRQSAAGEAVGERAGERAGNQTVRRAKQVELHSAQQAKTVTLLMQIEAAAEERIGVLIQLHPSQGDAHIPVGMELCLCSPKGQCLQSVRATSQNDYIQLTRFHCPIETRFQVQIKLGETVIVEPFVT